MAKVTRTHLADESGQTIVLGMVLLVGVFTIFAWMLNRAFWKDIK